MKTSHKEVQLAEVGPRFEMRRMFSSRASSIAHKLTICNSQRTRFGKGRSSRRRPMSSGRCDHISARRGSATSCRYLPPPPPAPRFVLVLYLVICAIPHSGGPPLQPRFGCRRACGAIARSTGRPRSLASLDVKSRIGPTWVAPHWTSKIVPSTLTIPCPILSLIDRKSVV